MKNKGGQFYLLAAIVIIVLILGYVGVSNYINKKNTTKVYDVKEELNIEGSEVLEYGVLNSGDLSLTNENDVEIAKGEDAVIKHFIALYTTYLESVGENMNIYYILGNKDAIKAYKIVDVDTGSLTLNLGGVPSSTKIIQKLIQELEASDKKTEEGKVIITIGENDYPFTLKKGENFYFIVSQNVGGEKYVETN